MAHPTMRAMSSAPVTATLNATTIAMLAIGFQMEYFEGGRLFIPDVEKALNKARQLIGFADTHCMSVFHVQHLGPAGGPLFARDGNRIAFHLALKPHVHHSVVQKTTASSFASTNLHQQLQSKGTKTLIVCGLMTHMCVSTTARDARPLGYQVIVAGDACATLAIDAWDGGVIAHVELHRAALTEVSDSFAEVLLTEQITALAVH